MVWDTIVIGSGAGGLTAAVALARAGQRVLVLEQHYLPGGWCHSFTLEGYRFSPGVHYIGQLQAGGQIRRMYEGLGLSRYLEFCEMNPDGYDHMLIAGERFDIPKGRDRYLARLLARFPEERAGLVRYFETLDDIALGLEGMEDGLTLAKIALLPFRHPHLVRGALKTLSSLLNRCVENPALRAILAGQCGNHGLPPSRASLALHASMTRHYYDGAFYPRGGAKSIPQAMIKILQQRRGKIRMRTRVRRILLDGARAVGVELEDGERIHAGSVISNADPALTFGKLVAEERGRRERRKAQRMEYTTSLLSVFCAVDLDLRAMGFDSGNYWWYRHRDLEHIYRATERSLPRREVDGLFVTVTTLKDPGHVSQPGRHTIEMFTFVPYGPFARFSRSTQGLRGPEYEQLKEALGQKMLDAAEHVIPGIREHLRFFTVGTPLTNDFYCETHRGASYGTAKTPWQLGPFSFRTRTSIRGLYLCGQSTLSHGVAGAALSGLIAAREVLGTKRIEDLLGPADGSLRVFPADEPELWLPGAARGAEIPWQPSASERRVEGLRAR